MPYILTNKRKPHVALYTSDDIEEIASALVALPDADDHEVYASENGSSRSLSDAETLALTDAIKLA